MNNIKLYNISDREYIYIDSEETFNKELLYYNYCTNIDEFRYENTGYYYFYSNYDDYWNESTLDYEFKTPEEMKILSSEQIIKLYKLLEELTNETN